MVPNLLAKSVLNSGQLHFNSVLCVNTVSLQFCHHKLNMCEINFVAAHSTPSISITTIKHNLYNKITTATFFFKQIRQALILDYVGTVSYHDLLLYLLEFQFYFLGEQKKCTL